MKAVKIILLSSVPFVFTYSAYAQIEYKTELRELRLTPQLVEKHEAECRQYGGHLVKGVTIKLSKGAKDAFVCTTSTKSNVNKPDFITVDAPAGTYSLGQDFDAVTDVAYGFSTTVNGSISAGIPAINCFGSFTNQPVPAYSDQLHMTCQATQVGVLSDSASATIGNLFASSNGSIQVVN